MKKKQPRRSGCPISFALETFGDLWSLLIIRDMVYFGKQTYGEFLESDEKIATNILADRLANLEEKGVLTKHPHPKDKRKEIYRLTEKGIDLIPIVFEIANWGAKYDPQTEAPVDWLTLVEGNRDAFVQRTMNAVRAGRAIFAGENNLFDELMNEAKTAP